MCSRASATSPSPGRPPGVLKGEYGATPAPMNEELAGAGSRGCEPITCARLILSSPSCHALRANCSRSWQRHKGHQSGCGRGPALTMCSPTRCFPRSDCAFSNIAAIHRPLSDAPGEELRLRPRAAAAPPAPRCASSGQARSTRSRVGTAQLYHVEVSEGGEVTSHAASPVAARAALLPPAGERPGCRSAHLWLATSSVVAVPAVSASRPVTWC
jgi:oxaloacetate decarboxylase alpha subunit